ncbi:MAG: pilus (MSHA type) biogenesis protein MshL [Magnetococcales bacterium]|nr:pilus (MSHA type) biogenesis protein MshL [Magnetococcales bacterium]
MASHVRRTGLILLGCLLLAACEPASRIKQSRDHFLQPTNPEVEISAGPTPKKDGAPLASLAEMSSPEEVYTITVTEMPVRDLLFALARDANKNIDVYPGIQGRVTLSAIDQPLGKILDRVAKQVAIRYEIQDKTIVVTPDLPFLKIYQVDYLGIERELVSTNKLSTHLSTAKGNALSNPLTGADNNQSNSTLTTASSSKFWKTITQNIQAILGADVGIEFQSSPEAALPPGGMGSPGAAGIGAAGLGAAAAGLPQGGGLGGLGGLGGIMPPQAGGVGAVPGRTDNKGGSSKPGLVSVNTEAGVMSIVATAQQHTRIQEYLDSVLENVHRQVLIESTVVEVELSDRFQEGVDWDLIFNRSAGVILKSAFSESAGALNAASRTAQGTLNYFTLGHTGGPDGNARTDKGPVNATIKLLETFGNAKILSSPKIMALNNQPAILKVVKNSVFFTLKSSTGNNNSGTNSNTTGTVASQPVFDTEIHTVPVGLVMTVTPQISKEGIVSLNVRPTISRISRWVSDPNPALVAGNLQTGLTDSINNAIPEIEVKEMETMMRVHSGQVAVMGGLMQDSISNGSAGVPMLSRLPGGLGALFSHQDQGVSKSELVIFLRPVVMTHGRPKEQVAERPREVSPAPSAQPAASAASAQPAASAVSAQPAASAPAKSAAAATPEKSAPAKPTPANTDKGKTAGERPTSGNEARTVPPVETPAPAAPASSASAATPSSSPSPAAPTPAKAPPSAAIAPSASPSAAAAPSVPSSTAAAPSASSSAAAPSSAPPSVAPSVPPSAAAAPSALPAAPSPRGNAANAMAVGSYLDFTSPEGQANLSGSSAPAFPSRAPQPLDPQP